MEPHQSTTPFGRRSLTLAHVASQANAKTRPTDKAVHKWLVFRSICTAKIRIGVSDRALAVLNALLTFHPETALTGESLVVFPSNQQLMLRAHGIAPATLRRHLAALVDAGLIIRRDSPNGKRYVRKGRGEEVTQAFGFDISPLVVRAEELEQWAEDIRQEERALKFVKEKITLCRRDIVKMIATGMEEGVVTRSDGQGLDGWEAVHGLYLELVGRIPRVGTWAALAPIAEELSMLADEILSLLENHIKAKETSANESQTERHIQNSNTKSPVAFEPGFQRSKAGSVEGDKNAGRVGEGSYPLGMVLDACPDMHDYAKGGISNWREFLATISVVRPMLGISPSAWEEAQAIIGEVQAAVAVACILQKGSAINSAGAYLRGLTSKAEAGEFSLGPMLMALLSGRRREKRSA